MVTRSVTVGYPVMSAANYNDLVAKRLHRLRKIEGVDFASPDLLRKKIQ